MADPRRPYLILYSIWSCCSVQVFYCFLCVRVSQLFRHLFVASVTLNLRNLATFGQTGWLAWSEGSRRNRLYGALHVNKPSKSLFLFSFCCCNSPGIEYYWHVGMDLYDKFYAFKNRPNLVSIENSKWSLLQKTTNL